MDVASDALARNAELVGGPTLKASLGAAAEWLERHRDAIDALNVFPVPDGDTGLNMSLTLRAAADEAQSADGTLDDVAAAMSRGALMGARGNSGVILAELLRGIAREIAGREAIDARTLARALEAGATAAYGAVSNPVEGTILTVARRTAEAARLAADNSATLIETLERAHEAARVAVAETPEQLPILKQAAVVDSGGEGLRVLLEGVLLHLRGEPTGSGDAPVGMRVDFSSLHADEDDFYGYCTEVLVRGEGLRPEAIRARLTELGTCVLVVGDSELMKVHVHTPLPGAVLNMATDMGELVRVKIDNMQLQRRDFEATVAGKPRPKATTADPLQPGTSIVAVALGAGFQEIFESYGATVVRADHTMNPSVQEILDAIEQTDRTDVVVLPNDPNVALAARQAAKQATGRKVVVVPTESMPRGIAAALAVSPESPADMNASSMAAAAGHCHWVEIARAVRAARIGDVDVDNGQLFSTLDGVAVAAGASYPELMRAALDRLDHGDAEIATVFVGRDGNQDGAEQIAEAIRARLDIEVEIAVGGQPHHDYVVSLE
jgi:DAK2 domain fusion protein YloV